MDKTNEYSTHQKRQLLDAANLPKRWLLKYHPLYEVAVKQLSGTIEAIEDHGTQESMNEERFGFATLSEIQAITLKKSTEAIRYSKMKELFNPLLEIAKQSDVKFRKVYANALKFVNAMESLDFEAVAGVSNAYAARLPDTKNDRNTSTANLANKKRKAERNRRLTKRKNPACSACTFYCGNLDYDHRPYSKKCPQSKNPDHRTDKSAAEERKQQAVQLSQSALSCQCE